MTPKTVRLYEGQQAERALRRAEVAFLDGRFSDVVRDAREALKSEPTTIERRHAIRLVAVGSCINHDDIALHEAWQWLGPLEREAVLDTCAHAAD